MKISLKGKSASALCGLTAAGLSAAAFIAFIIYGAVYTVYFDAVILLALLLGAAGNGAYALVDRPWAEFLGLAGVVCLGYGAGLFVLNAYPVMADWYGQFNMYGSQGGLAPVVVIAVLTLAAIVAGVVACFTRKGAA